MAIGALLLLSADVARAQVSSDECCVELLEPLGARALALGHAIVARPGAGSLFTNPAAVADADADQLLVHTSKTVLGRSNTFSVLIHSEAIGTIGMTYRLIDLGELPATDDFGNVIGEISLLNHVLTATYATRLATGLRAGLSYKLFQFRQDCRGFCGVDAHAATSHLMDAGVQYRVPLVRDLEVGAALLHIGFPLQVVNAEQASPTPSRIRLGVAHEVLQYVRPDSSIALWLSGDVETAVRRPGAATLSIGAELAIEETIFLWLGYGGATGLQGGAGIGVGLQYDRFRVGVAKSFVSSIVPDSDPFQVTFGIRF
ncbi:MAG: hypothetical protein ACRELX_18490 [Longimicrobiales bacterium]